ncbi:MAG: hypothetical protein ICV78_13110 [Tolypothrix sp. Co-bin9]|nr:hypothetical protein [Tolypothrix sp. Co-bin9]
MTKQILYPAQANLKMSLWQANADSMSSSDLYVWLNDSGLPTEVTIRLHELASYTKKSGNKVYAVGKIILIKIIEFVKAHPHLTVGVAVGASVGFLINQIPVIGQFLAPLAAALGIVIFGVAGHRVDKRSEGKEVHGGIMGFAEDIVEIVKAFFDLIVDVFNIILENA